MIKEIFKIESRDKDDRPYHLLLTRENKGRKPGETEDTEEIVASFMLDPEQVAAFIEHLADRLEEAKSVVGFSINFEVKTVPDPDDGLKSFVDNIRDRL